MNQKIRHYKLEKQKWPLIDSESVCSILNESLVTTLINDSSLARWLTTAAAKILKIFADEPIPLFGMFQTPVKSKRGNVVGETRTPNL